MTTTQFRTDTLRSLLAEMQRDGVRPAGQQEPGWYWLSLDGRRYWVTSNQVSE